MFEPQQDPIPAWGYSGWDHFPPFRGRVSVTLAEIAEQRKKGWTDFHPEDFCHRCGGRNLSWWIDSTVWNPVMRPDGPDSSWQWNEIICPFCFAELFERKWPLTSFEFKLSELTTGAKAFRAEQARSSSGRATGE